MLKKNFVIGLKLKQIKQKMNITVSIIHNNFELYCIMIEKLIIRETKTTVERTNEQIMVILTNRMKHVYRMF